MLAFKLNPQTLRVARAIGDNFVEYNPREPPQFFVYYEEDDTFEIISEKEFIKSHGMKNGFPVTVFSSISDTKIVV
jgi:hypothetical protein